MEMEKKEGKRLKILLVDDEQSFLELAEMKIKSLGHDVITAANGKDCLKIAEGETPDLILLDILMPGMDGGETAQLLLENPKTKDIPIIFLTCVISEREERECLGKIGGRLFVAKPLDMKRLLAAIEKALKS